MNHVNKLDMNAHTIHHLFYVLTLTLNSVSLPSSKYGMRFNGRIALSDSSSHLSLLYLSLCPL